MWANVGKLLSNFKGFYNEINSATLTGAIDVVIIQQQDGTYLSSPFHVRFGKTGVLRAREKVVDIEINDEPVDLHMKLGEAGEAFFVQQVQEDTEIPAHLATSPINLDAESFMEQGIKQLKQMSMDKEKLGDRVTFTLRGSSPVRTSKIIETTPPHNLSNIGEENIVDDHTVRQSSSQTEELYDTSVWDDAYINKVENTADEGSEYVTIPTVEIVNENIGIAEKSNDYEANEKPILVKSAETSEKENTESELSKTTEPETFDKDDSHIVNKSDAMAEPDTSKVNANNKCDQVTPDESSGGTTGAAVTPDESSCCTTVAGVVRDESMASMYFSTVDSPTIELPDPPATTTAKIDKSVQTYMTGPEIESQAKTTEKGREKKVSVETQEKENCDETSSAVIDSTSSKATDVYIQSTSTGGSTELVRPKALRLDLVHRDSECSQSSADSRPTASTSDRVVPKKKVAKRKRRRSIRALEVLGSDSSDNSGGSIPDGGVFDMDLDGEEETDSGSLRPNTLSHGMGKTVSKHCSQVKLTDTGCLADKDTVVDKHMLTAEWAKSQFSHPWSDADITPVTSPISSRPPSPKSDTEYETTKFDCSSQTSITGIGEEFNKVDDLQWEWGQLPTPVRQISDETSKTERIATPELEKPPGGLFHFMRKTKKIRHQPEKEGIYLDDLNLEDMDPEVTALYLYNNKSDKNPRNHLTSVLSMDEDVESGRGASLPLSPISMDSGTVHSDHENNQTHPINSLFRPVNHKKNHRFEQVSMSLCGGLKDKDSSEAGFHDKFTRHLVSYEDFCANPSMLTNHNLVFKIDDKYYNYQMAGPMFLSYIVFNRFLPEPVVDSLVSQHMPKKESRRRGWFSWGRGYEHNTTTATATTPTDSQPTTSQSSVPNSPSKLPPGSSILASEELSGPSVPTLSHAHTIIDLHQHNSPTDSSTQSQGNNNNDSEDVIKNTDFGALGVGNKTGLPKSHSTSVLDQIEDNGPVYEKTLKLSNEQIEKLKLKRGKNVAVFSVTTQYQGTARCQANIFLWNYDAKIIVSDVDGTITRSDVLGHVLPLVGKDWSQVGITSLYNEIERNGYKFIYLTARAIGQAGMTRDYLRSITQENNLKLPEGPLLLSPNSLVRAFHKEVIEKKPEEFKIGCLRNIKALFPRDKNPFYAGFGNKINDAFTYRTVEIPMSRIFTVNHRGELRMELIANFLTTYTKLKDIVDMFFPPILDEDVMKLNQGAHPRVFSGADEFSSFTFWREPILDISIDIENELLQPESSASKKETPSTSA